MLKCAYTGNIASPIAFTLCISYQHPDPSVVLTLYELFVSFSLGIDKISSFVKKFLVFFKHFDLPNKLFF